MKGKQLFALFLAVVLTLSCTACDVSQPPQEGTPQPPAPSQSVPEQDNTQSPSTPEPAPVDDLEQAPGIPAVLAARYLLDFGYPLEEELPQLTVLTIAGEEFDTYCTDIYGIDREKVEDGVILSPTGVEAREIAIFRMTDEEAALEAQVALDLYRTNRQAAFAGYAPDQEAFLRTAAAEASGCWAMFLCIGTYGASAAMVVKQFISQQTIAGLSCTTEGLRPKYTLARDTYLAPIFLDENGYELFLQPGIDPLPIYDTTAIVSAWTNGDEGTLSDEEREILSVCREAMKVVQDGMSDYEKELALHDWLVVWADYNKDELGNTNPPSPNDVSPYGILVERRGTCMGYANSFQLLMDLAGVPCMTISGAVIHSLGDHAWNIVELDGEWYGVDVTWNDPFGAAEHYGDDKAGLEARYHRYFNITSDYMREKGYLWDYYNTPEATGTKYAWTAES